MKIIIGKPFYERSLKKRQERQRIQRQQNDRMLISRFSKTYVNSMKKRLKLH